MRPENPAREPDRNPVEILGEEFLAQRRRGESVDIHHYVRMHPQHADEIRALFPAMLAMEDLKLQRKSADRPIRLRVDRLEALGDYRILREIGHGGMGIVYEAEQQSLRRRVAVKVFPEQSLADSRQLQRFQREAKTAGRLHHSNIVPVFGVGHQDGLHYFVMQFIDGVSLDRIIRRLSLGASSDSAPSFDRAPSAIPLVPNSDSFSLALKQEVSDREVGRSTMVSGVAETMACDHTSMRAASEPVTGTDRSPSELPQPSPVDPSYWRRVGQMGAEIADALQYAHAHGVTHRDIKPSNLILANDDRVWVTDFGLAMTHGQDRISKSGDVVGTLRYVAPEQLSGESDFRSDIYGLGITLYELATLRPAFDDRNRGTLIQQVAESSPPRPRVLCPSMPRDLETIILKSISRSPESRYRTAGDLAEDLRRFCEDEPIHARRIGPVERTVRWARRNPPLAVMSLALLLGGLVSLAAVSWNWRNALLEKQNAVAEGQRAENNLALALTSMDRLLQQYESDWMAHPIDVEERSGDSNRGMRFTVSDQSAEVFEEALRFYDQFVQANSGNRDLALETGRAYRRAGDLLQRLGRDEDAERAYHRGSETLMELISYDNLDDELIAECANILNRLAMIQHRIGDSRESLDTLEQAKQILTRQLNRIESSKECTYQLALTNSNQGLVWWQAYQREETASRHQRAIFLLEGLVETNPLEAKYRLTLARAYRNYYPIAMRCNQVTYARQLRHSATTILEKLVADFPHVPDYRCELSEMLVAFPLDNDWDGSAMNGNLARARELAEKLHQEFSSIPRYQTVLASVLNAQAIQLREHSIEEAIPLHERSVELLRGLSTRFPEASAYHYLLGKSLHAYGRSFAASKRTDEAICVFEESVDEQKLFLQIHGSTIRGRKMLAAYGEELAEVLEQAGNVTLACETRDAACKSWRARPPAE